MWKQKDKEAGSPISIYIGNQGQYATSSVKVMIKFPYTNDSTPDEDEQKEKLDDNAREFEPTESDNNKKGELLFQGVVRDDHDNVLTGAVVKLFACYQGGIEKPIADTCTDSEGVYLINIPAPVDYDELDGFKVRAGKCSLPPQEEIDQPASTGKPGLTKENNYNFLDHILNNRNKTIFDVMK